MDIENEPLPAGERASIEQQTDEIPSLQHPVAPAPPTQQITRFLDDIRHTPGSNVQRIHAHRHQHSSPT